MDIINFSNVKLTDGFLKQVYDRNKNVSIPAVYARFKETGRIDAFKCEYDGENGIRPHVFWDSDVAKWIESVAYLIKNGETVPELEEKADLIIDDMANSMAEDGYYNCYYLTLEKDKRFTNRNNHELYCLGHLIEAAIAYDDATGKSKMLNCVKKYTSLVKKIFMEEKSSAFTTPGHQEIELALIKLYRYTNDPDYLEMAKFFIFNRGCSENDFIPKVNPVNFQSHKKATEQTVAEGHSVRALYMFSAIADLALETNDQALRNQVKTVFDDIVANKMFITGGVGSNSRGESFAHPYYLPNLNAYAETCAGIALAFFAHRLQRLFTNSLYADVIERLLYNGVLSGVDLIGDHFFYENPLELRPELNSLGNMHYPIPQRVKIFSCSCCPPNVNRFFASLGNYFYSFNDKAIYVNQFSSSVSSFSRNGTEVSIKQSTEYPKNGIISISYSGADDTLAIRVPSWSNAYANEKSSDGYLYIPVKNGDVIDLDFQMRVRVLSSNPKVRSNCSKVAVSHGPMIYCLEQHDNPYSLDCIAIDPYSPALGDFSHQFNAFTIKAKGFDLDFEASELYFDFSPTEPKPIDLTLIPYFAFANRSVGEMSVWLPSTFFQKGGANLLF